MENKFSIPLAIIIAGLLIAGALFITRDAEKAPSTNDRTATETDIPVEPLSNDDHILGSPEAALVLIEFSDTECPFCKQFHNTLHRIIDTYGRDGDVAWVYRHFPIDELHSKARKQAEATECAAKLGGNSAFWKYIDRLYEITPSNNGLDMTKLPEIAVYIGLDRASFEQCLASGSYADEVNDDYLDAVDSLGRGTPHSVLVSEKPFNNSTLDIIQNAALELPDRTLILSPDKTKLVISGALPYDFLKLIIDASLGKPTQ